MPGESYTSVFERWLSLIAAHVNDVSFFDDSGAGVVIVPELTLWALPRRFHRPDL